MEKMRAEDDGEGGKKSANAKKAKLRKGRMQSAAPGELLGLMMGKNQ